MIREIGLSHPQDAIDVAGKNGQKKSFALKDISEMLYDPRKIIELNLIDNIDLWARTKAN